MSRNNLSAGGRPANIYRMSPADFQHMWSTSERSDKPLLEDGFATVGYLTTEGKLGGMQHVVRLTLLPTDPSCAFFWFRFESPNGKWGFHLPSVIARDDVAQLLQVWEFEDATWLPGAIASPVLPDDWTMGTFATFAGQFYVVTSQLSANKRSFQLEMTGGLHLLKSKGRDIAGVVAPNTAPFLLRKMFEPGTPIFLNEPLAPKRLHAMWGCSADYSKHVLLEYRQRGKVFPYVPHAALINLPPTGLSELRVDAPRSEVEVAS